MALRLGSITRRSTDGHTQVSLPLPEVHEIRITDIAHALAQIVRSGGWFEEPIPVGQHSIETSWLCEQEARRWDHDPAEAGLAGLLHDAPEAYIGDQISSMKRLMGATWRDIDHDCTERVNIGLGVSDIMRRHQHIVKWADLEMLVSDMSRWAMLPCVVMNSADTHRVMLSERHVVPAPFVLRYPDATLRPWRETRDLFIARYHDLCDRIPGARPLARA